MFKYLKKIDGKKIEERSIKAQEKFADQCMTVSTTVINAVFVAILVYPFIEFIKSTADPNIITISFAYILSVIKKINLPLFIVVYFLPLAFAFFLRERAFDIYDRVNEKLSNAPKKLPKRKNNPINRL